MADTIQTVKTIQKVNTVQIGGTTQVVETVQVVVTDGQKYTVRVVDSIQAMATIQKADTTNMVQTFRQGTFFACLTLSKWWTLINSGHYSNGAHSSTVAVLYAPY